MIAVFLQAASHSKFGIEVREVTLENDRTSILQSNDKMFRGGRSLDVSFETSEGTFMTVDVSPDGDMLAFDLLGDIYLLPVTGGEAVPVTSGRDWDQAPRFSIDGEYVYFVSDRKGPKNVWRTKLSDRSTHEVSESSADVVGGLNWSQASGNLIASVADPRTENTEFTLHSIDPNEGVARPIDAKSAPWIDMETFKPHRRSVRVYSGVQVKSGTVFFSEAQFDTQRNRLAARIYSYDPREGIYTDITPQDAAYNEYTPQLSPDGQFLAYFRQYENRTTQLRSLEFPSGRDRVLAELANSDDAAYGASHDLRPNYSFTPDGRYVVLSHGGKIRKIGVTDGSNVEIPFSLKVKRHVWSPAKAKREMWDGVGEARVIRWPTLSRDRERMVFAALGYIWLRDMRTNNLRRLTKADDFEYMPAISPDGQSVAYTSFSYVNGTVGPGRLMVVEVESGEVRELQAAPNTNYLLLKWSPDGSMIAAIREIVRDNKIDAVFGWTLAMGGTFHEVAPAPASDDLASLYLYSRYICFDNASEQLLLSYPTSRNEIALDTVRLDGTDRKTVALGTSEVGGITPESGLAHLALTRRDGTVWTVPFDRAVADVRVSTVSHDARKVSNGAGYYVDWSLQEGLTYSFGKTFYVRKTDGADVRSIDLRVRIPEQEASKLVAFTGARLITMADENSESVVQQGTIVLDGHRISAVGPTDDVEVPKDATVIEAVGKTIIPGFIDTHYHRIGGSNGAIGLSAFKLPNSSFEDRSAIAYGITTAWEPGGPVNDASPATADLQLAGRIVGPRWSYAAMGSVGYPWEQLTSYESALAVVQQYRALGVNVLKEYGTPVRKQRQWLSEAAYHTGVGIVSHIDNLEDMLTGVVDGFTGGDHAYVPIPLYRDVLELIHQSGYFWTPNIVITVGTIGGSTDATGYYLREAFDKRAHEREKLRSATSADRADQIVYSPPTAPYEHHRSSRLAQHVAAASAYGIRIGVSGHNMPGIRLHSELWHLREGGLSEGQVLRAATLGNAEKLGVQEQVGSLEVGKIADILVLDANPLEDILNTLSLKYTVQGGVVYDSLNAREVSLAE